MKKKVLVFFPHNLWPPRTGAHQRCLELMAGLKALDCSVTLASSTLSSEAVWDTASMEHLKDEGLRDVQVYEATAEDYDFLGLLYQLRRMKKRLSHPRRTFYLARKLLNHHPPLAATLRGAVEAAPINSIQYTPPAMRRWFAKILKESEADVVVMSYAHWDGLLDHKKLNSTLRIIDTLDLVSLNSRMQHAVAKYLPTPLAAGRTPDQVLKENFFEELSVHTASEEFRIFDKYDHTIAITAKEADLIRQHTRRTKVSWLPVTLEPCYIHNTYSHSALFTVGPNLFNVQGYLYFVKKVLPDVLRRAPSFSLQVTGSFSFYSSTAPEPATGVNLSGFVPDLKSVYETARFFICPVFGGTGQQIKIVEAMAHGLPVIALRFAAERSPLRHEVNGLVADNAEEFIEHTVRLWNDSELCRRLGSAARETVAGEFSRNRMTEGLSNILGI